MVLFLKIGTRFNRTKLRLMCHMCTHMLRSKSIDSTFSIQHTMHSGQLKDFYQQNTTNWQQSIWTKFKSHSLSSYMLWCCIHLIGQLSKWKVRKLQCNPVAVVVTGFFLSPYNSTFACIKYGMNINIRNEVENVM